jgi:hypothetical protein
LALCLPGCATLAARRQFDALPLLTPSSFGVETTQMQRLTIGRISGGPTITLDAAVEIDAEELRVAGMLLGQRVLLLAWDGRQLMESREPVVPSSIDGRAVLRDLQLVYWPADAIRTGMPQGCGLEEQDEQRRVLCGGRLVLETWRGDSAPLGAARLQNHIGHYAISIESAQ